MRKRNVVDWIALILLIIGGINWGLIGFFGLNLLGAIFGGEMSGISRFLYALVGLSALYVATMPTVFAQEECLPPASAMKGAR